MGEKNVQYTVTVSYEGPPNAGRDKRIREVLGPTVETGYDVDDDTRELIYFGADVEALVGRFIQSDLGDLGCKFAFSATRS